MTQTYPGVRPKVYPVDTNRNVDVLNNTLLFQSSFLAPPIIGGHTVEGRKWAESLEVLSYVQLFVGCEKAPTTTTRNCWDFLIFPWNPISRSSEYNFETCYCRTTSENPTARSF